MFKRLKIYILLILPILFLTFLLLPTLVKAGEIYAIGAQVDSKDFYVYNTVTNSWTQLADLPANTGNGRSLVYPGSGDYVYALRGGGNTAFYRYNIRTRPASWETAWGGKTAAQLATPGAIGVGGSIFYSPSYGGRMYVLGGNGANKLYSFNFLDNTWRTEPNVPFNVGAGGYLTGFRGTNTYFYLSVLKGGAAKFTNYCLSPACLGWAVGLYDLPFVASVGSSWVNTGMTDDYDRYALIKPSSGSRYFGKYNGSWTALASPPPTTGATLADGDAMVRYACSNNNATCSNNNTNYLYNLRANNTADFYRYNISNNTWTSMNSAPVAFGSSSSLAVVPSIPGVVGSISGTIASNTRIDLAWSYPTDDGGKPIVSYVVERLVVPEVDWTPLGSTSNMTFSDTTITRISSGVNYRIKAWNVLGEGVPAVYSVTVTAPVAPTNLTASPYSSSQINLSWTAPSGVVNGYKIERQNPDGQWEILVANTGNASTTYQDVGSMGSNFPVLGVDTGSEANWSCAGINGGSSSSKCSAIRAPLVLTAKNREMTSNYCYLPGSGLLSFSWIYYDSDNNPETRSHLQIDDSPIFDSPEINVDYIGDSPTNSHSLVVSANPTEGQLPFNESNKTYYWRVKVYNNLGLNSGWIDGEPFKTEPHPWPNTEFSFSPSAPRVNQKVSFTDKSLCYTDAQGTPYYCKNTNPLSNELNTYAWAFGDSTTSNTIGDTSHTYNSSKTYPVSLKICDEIGCCSDTGDVKTSGVTAPEWREVSPF